MNGWKKSEFGSIPRDWDFIKGSNYCSKVTDGTHDSPKRKQHGKPLITSKHIKSRYIDFENAYYISDHDFMKINERSQVDQWDVVISMIGEYCGFTYIERNTNINYAVKNVGLFKAGNKINALWLHYYLMSPLGQYILDTNKSGSSQPYISLGALRDLPILNPPVEDKKYIVEILSSLDDKIDLLHRQNKTLEAMAETLFLQWFVEEAKEDWEEGKLGDLIEVKYGKDHKILQDGHIPVYGSGGIMRHADKALFEGESVLIPRKGTLNNVMYINEPFWTVDTMFYTVMKRDNLAKFIYFFIKEKDLASMNVGSAVPSMTTVVLNNMPVHIPDELTLETFENSVSPLFKKIEINHKQIKILEKLRDSLLPKLMSGEIKIK